MDFLVDSKLRLNNDLDVKNRSNSDHVILINAPKLSFKKSRNVIPTFRLDEDTYMNKSDFEVQEFRNRRISRICQENIKYYGMNKDVMCNTYAASSVMIIKESSENRPKKHCSISVVRTSLKKPSIIGRLENARWK
jgi:hypothetical protein